MFFVFNKDKIYAYIVSIFTVIILFYVASNVHQINNEVIETSSNLINEQIRTNTNQVENEINTIK